jgi:tRNA-dihydrouridine synthase A
MFQSNHLATKQLSKFFSLMLGRAAYHQPYLLSEVDNKIYHKTLDAPSREQILLDFIEYIKQQNDQGVPIRSMTRHILGLYQSF